MDKQISIFELLGEEETPLIPLEQQKKGKRGWIIEVTAILLRKNGYKEDAICVCTRPVLFEADSYIDKKGIIHQEARTTYGPSSGWYGGRKKVYAKRPTWEECVQFAKEDSSYAKEISKVIYMERDGKWNETWKYEDGYKKGA